MAKIKFNPDPFSRKSVKPEEAVNLDGKVEEGSMSREEQMNSFLDSIGGSVADEPEPERKVIRPIVKATTIPDEPVEKPKMRFPSPDPKRKPVPEVKQTEKKMRKPKKKDVIEFESS